MKRSIIILVLLMAFFVISGCGKMEPAAYHPVDEVPQGPGLFTGKKGAVVIRVPDEASSEDEIKTAPDKKSTRNKDDF